MSIFLRSTLIASILICICTAIGHTQPNFLDHQFSNDGLLYPSINGSGQGGIIAIKVLPDQKIVINAGGTLQKLKPNGTRDISFSENGIYNFPANLAISLFVYDLIVQPDGNMIFGASKDDISGIQPFLMRIRADGNGLDNTFGNNGFAWVDTSYHFGDYVETMALHPDGSLFLSGHLYEEYYIIKFTPQGIVDSSFGINGAVRTSFDPNVSHANVMNVLPDGKILVGGGNSYDYVLVRHMPNGSLDTSFNHTGIKYAANNNEGGYGILHDMKMQPDGKIVVCGRNPISSDGFHLMRFQADGNTDTSFNHTGEQRIFIDSTGDAFKLALLPNGRMVVSGTYENGKTNWGVIRLLPNGQPDYSFGDNGAIKMPLPNSTQERVECMDVQADDKILLGGYYRPDVLVPDEMVMARITNDETFIQDADVNINSIFCYPNPADKSLCFNASLKKITAVTIFAEDGREIKIAAYPNNCLNVQDLPQGIYTICVELEQKAFKCVQISIAH